MPISKSTLVLALATAFYAAPANADINYSIVGTYTVILGGGGQPRPDLLASLEVAGQNHWKGTLRTDDLCITCTPGAGLLGMDLALADALCCTHVTLNTLQFATPPTFDVAAMTLRLGFRQWVLPAPGFFEALTASPTDPTHTFWFDFGSEIDAGTYIITPLAAPEPTSAALLAVVAGIIAARSRRRRSRAAIAVRRSNERQTVSPSSQRRRRVSVCLAFAMDTPHCKR